jgi:hypothetical protein
MVADLWSAPGTGDVFAHRSISLKWKRPKHGRRLVVGARDGRCFRPSVHFLEMETTQACRRHVVGDRDGLLPYDSDETRESLKGKWKNVFQRESSSKDRVRRASNTQIV